MRYTQKEYEDMLRKPEPVMDFSGADLRSLKDLTPEYALDNPFIEKMIFKDAKLPKSFIEQIVSRKGTYDEVFADMFGGLALRVDFSGIDFSSVQLNMSVARDNFYYGGFILKGAKFKWDNGETDTVEHRALKSKAQKKDLEKKVDLLLEESAINDGDDSKIESIATQLSALFESHPFVTEKYYFTYNVASGYLIDLRPALEKYKKKAFKTLASDYSLGRKIERFFSFGRKASQVRVASKMLRELKSEIRELKRDLGD